MHRRLWTARFGSDLIYCFHVWFLKVSRVDSTKRLQSVAPVRRIFAQWHVAFQIAIVKEEKIWQIWQISIDSTCTCFYFLYNHRNDSLLNRTFYWRTTFVWKQWNSLIYTINKSIFVELTLDICGQWFHQMPFLILFLNKQSSVFVY